MRLCDFLTPNENQKEKPLERFVPNGGFCGIFRKIACIGDSLSSGEFESLINGVKGYHDYYDYSWGQFLARDAGCTVYNFSRGGMTAKEYCTGFADSQNFWSPEYIAQAYILALGVNDVSTVLNGEIDFGSAEDANLEDYKNNKPTFAGYYAQIIQRYQKMQPKAKFFLMTMPRSEEEPKRKELYDAHAVLVNDFSQIFEHCYVLDFRKYVPLYDSEFRKNFYVGGHLSAAGYRLTAWMVETYIDYIIRHHQEDFKQIGFVGTAYYNESEPW